MLPSSPTRQAPRGAFALWSNDSLDEVYAKVLQHHFTHVNVEVVAFPNPLQGGRSTNTVYWAQNAKRRSDGKFPSPESWIRSRGCGDACDFFCVITSGIAGIRFANYETGFPRRGCTAGEPRL